MTTQIEAEDFINKLPVDQRRKLVERIKSNLDDQAVKEAITVGELFQIQLKLTGYDTASMEVESIIVMLKKNAGLA